MDDKTNEQNTANAGVQTKLKSRYKSDFTSDLLQHDEYVLDFDAFEAMLMGRTYDAVSKETSSGITDSATTTIYYERAGRVVGQVPSGVMKAAGKKDAGKAQLLDLVLHKYIIPNANAQRPFLTKQRMWDFYSSVYGYMMQFVDHHVAPTSYIGPDTWLWSPRNFIPQQGRITTADMDYCNAISDVSAAWIKDLIKDVQDGTDDSGWNLENLQTLYKSAKDNSLWNDNTRDTFIKRQRQYQATHGMIPIVTRYEAGEDGHWVTFVPAMGYLLLRDIKNPHKTNRIPFFKKPCMPLFDSFYELGDFQRSMPIQFAKDGLTNFYFEGIKMNIYPPTVINANGVIKHTVDQSPGAIWQETQPNSVRRLETSTAGLSTYQAATTQMQASLQGIAGTTNTTMNAEAAMDPQFGKTPQALQMLAKQESTRDNIDRFLFEQEEEAMINYMLQVYVNVSTEKTNIDVFSKDIKEIVEDGYDDILDVLMIDGKSMTEWMKKATNKETGQVDPTKLPDSSSAKITVDPKSFKDLTISYELDQGTSKLEDNADKKASMDDFLAVISKNQNELQTLRNQGKELDWALIFETYGTLAGIPNMDKILKDVSPQQQAAELQQQQAEAQANAPVPAPKVAVRLNGTVTPNQELNVAQQQGFASQADGGPQPAQPQGAPAPMQQPGVPQPQMPQAPAPGPQFQNPAVAQAHAAMMAHPLVQASGAR